MALNDVINHTLGGRYQVLRRLGFGGFSHTFLAVDLHLPNHPRCVLKQFRAPEGQSPATQAMARRLFDNEAQILYELGNHPQIPTLLAHFEERHEVYLAQEYIDGSRLSHQMELGKPWSETRVVLLLQEVLEILAFVHRQHVIHRDVNPSNLIRRHRDGKVVLIDFGAVKRVRVLGRKTTTVKVAHPALTIGTRGYMPDEQRAGYPCFSSDVYAVGMMGIRALTGIRPHLVERDSASQEIQWRPYAPGVSSGLTEVINRMVSRDFHDRYPTAQDALDALQQLPNGFSASIAHLYQTWYRGVGGLVPSPISAPGDTQLIPTEIADANALAEDDTALLPVDSATLAPASLTQTQTAIPEA
ncbi:MAG: serine/threonine-protein kinase [Leptolyngbya sp.]|nr:serine/threonine-protein kinase [Leptolyngbya sp.]